MQSAAGFIAVQSSHKVVMRYFPELTFKLDDSVDRHMRIADLLHKINEEREQRHGSDTNENESELEEETLDDKSK